MKQSVRDTVATTCTLNGQHTGRGLCQICGSVLHQTRNCPVSP